jgi:adenine-specific DNA methylase
MQRYSPASGFPNMLLVGTYYIPPVGREIEAGSWYEGKLRALVKGYAAIRRAMPPGSEGLVAAADARQLDLPDDSIDYIFTDPPYADAVQYGELNFVWESWLGGTPDWHGDEIVVNRARGKDADAWAGDLAKAMGECHRVLKPGRWLSLCYHDTSADRWTMLQDLMQGAGFVIDSAAAAGSIETGQKSFNQWMSNKATKRDLVISFRKPRPGQPRPVRTVVAFPAAARQVLCEYLSTHGSATKDRLYDALVSHMVCRGQMQDFDFEALLRSVAAEGHRRQRGAASHPVWRLKK